MSQVEQVGRYALGHAIARGGMATLHLGRLVGSGGFARTVAIKRLHPHLCEDPSFVRAFGDEARLAARIRHPNVVPMLDVVSTDPSESGAGELLLVMEYVDGESLSALVRRTTERIPLPIVVASVSEMLHGLHAAHEATSEAGEPLGIVHRDVSPQNVLVGADGVARLVDFGIARATGAHGHGAKSATRDGDLKGKLAYMAPEQMRREPVTRRTDIFAAGIVLWELLTGARLFASETEAATLEKVLVGWVPPPSSIVRDLPPKLDEIALRALAAEPDDRFATAREMAVALEDALGRALGRDVAAWVEATAGETLVQRRALVARAERGAVTMQRPSRRAAARSFTLEMATVDNATATFDDATATVDNATATRGNATATFDDATATRDNATATRGNATATFGNAMATRGNATATRDNTRATLGSAVGVVSAEDEPTVTAFGASDDGAFGPTRAFGRRSVPPLLLAQGRHGSRNARVAVFTLATAITLLAGIVCSPDRVEGAPAVAIASLAPASEPAPQPSPPTAAAPTVAGASLAPASEAAPQPSPSIVTAPVVAVTPVETPLAPAVTEGKTSPTPAVARRPPKPRVAPRAAPCVAKVDPVSGKTIYLGSCD